MSFGPGAPSWAARSANGVVANHEGIGPFATAAAAAAVAAPVVAALIFVFFLLLAVDVAVGVFAIVWLL